MTTHWTSKLPDDTCSKAMTWAKSFRTFQKAWNVCERGDWMLWLIGKLSGKPDSDTRRKLVLTACKCARLSLSQVSAGELRPLKAIEAAEAWANRKPGITLVDVRKAANAANAADAAYAAYAAANAATYAAADAADAAANAAANAAADASVLKRCAEIVREAYPSLQLIDTEQRA